MTRAENRRDKPRVGITAGDLAGIGPEIVLKSVASPLARSTALVIIGDAQEIRRQADILGLRCPYPVARIADAASLDFMETTLLDTGPVSSPVEWGKLSPAAGRSAIEAVEAAARLCMEGKLDALATAPINKEAIRMAGSPFSGHTDMLASLCGVKDSLMCFIAGDLRVILITVHLSLADAINAITRERVLKTIRLADREMKRFGIKAPRLAFCGLNPHAGERGLMGIEEMIEIAPAIDVCRNESIDVSGPFPADTLFLRAARGEFDAVVACYHDQGLIAVKCLAFGKAVNVTLGLPIIRASVDHGTAFDIAGRGIADPSSMIEAIRLAARLASEEDVRYQTGDVSQ
ncbi:MAG: 4-hydroxythreonine-4-phosphate dehydrogenase PdxA [Acidobacteriota bacterium]